MSTQEQLDRYLKFLESDSGNLHLIQSAADCAYEIGNFEQAISISKQATTLAPENRGLKAIQAISNLALGEINIAQSLLEDMINEGEKNPAIYYNLAYCFALNNRFEDALALLTDAEQAYEKIPQMLHLKIQVLHYLTNIEAAILLAEHALSLNGQDAVLHGLISSLYIDNLQFDLAKKHAELAINNGNRNSDAYTSIGTLALSNQDDSTALQYFKDALEIKVNNGRAWLGKAMVEMLRQQFKEAKVSLDLAITYMPKHLGTWQALAWCQIAQNDCDGAEITLKKALNIDSNFAESHGALAIIQLIKGNLDMAASSIRRSLGLDKNSFSGLYAQALMLKNKGQENKADKIIQNILDAPSMPDQRSLREVLVKHLANQKN